MVQTAWGTNYSPSASQTKDTETSSIARCLGKASCPLGKCWLPGAELRLVQICFEFTAVVPGL